MNKKNLCYIPFIIVMCSGLGVLVYGAILEKTDDCNDSTLCTFVFFPYFAISFALIIGSMATVVFIPDEKSPNATKGMQN